MNRAPSPLDLRARRTSPDQLIAVVDIGSNSVRLVVYKGIRRNPVVFFNERVICGLGRGVGADGEMADGPIRKAIETLERFSHLCADMEVDQVQAVATAGVRNAANREEFLELVRVRCGFDVEVISGRDEARYSALGVLTGFPGADGIVGDMGGGSLEIANLVDGAVRERISLPIGPLSLAKRPGRVKTKHIEMVEAALAGVDWLTAGGGRPFFMVGGAWRALARMHMHKIAYPLIIHHAYSMAAPKMRRYAHNVSLRRPSDLPRVPTIAKSRKLVLPLTSMVLEQCLKAIGSSRAIVSGTGIREGLLFDRLPPKVRAEDPFISACRDLAEETGRFPGHAGSLMKWLDPLFIDEDEADHRIRRACCLLSDIVWRGHRGFKAAHAFHRAFEGEFVGVSHGERARTALALFVSYGGWDRGPEAARALRLLEDAEIDHARLVGLGLRLGQRLTGGTARPLKTTALEVTTKNLILRVPKEESAVAGGDVGKRLADLAAFVGRKPLIADAG